MADLQKWLSRRQEVNYQMCGTQHYLSSPLHSVLSGFSRPGKDAVFSSFGKTQWRGKLPSGMIEIGTGGTWYTNQAKAQEWQWATRCCWGVLPFEVFCTKSKNFPCPCCINKIILQVRWGRCWNWDARIWSTKLTAGGTRQVELHLWGWGDGNVDVLGFEAKPQLKCWQILSPY